MSVTCLHVRTMDQHCADASELDERRLRDHDSRMPAASTQRLMRSNAAIPMRADEHARATVLELLAAVIASLDTEPMAYVTRARVRC